MELKDNCTICIVCMTRKQVVRHLLHAKCAFCPICRSEYEETIKVVRIVYKITQIKTDSE